MPLFLPEKSIQRENELKEVFCDSEIDKFSVTFEMQDDCSDDTCEFDEDLDGESNEYQKSKLNYDNCDVSGHKFPYARLADSTWRNTLV